MQANQLVNQGQIANNHSLDEGEEVLESTINILDDNGIFLCMSQIQSFRIKTFYIKEINRYKISVYVCAETEFTIAEGQ